MLIAIFSYENVTIITVALTLLTIAIELIINKLKQKSQKYKKNENNNNKLPIGFILGVTNIITLLATNFIIFYA